MGYAIIRLTRVPGNPGPYKKGQSVRPAFECDGAGR